MGLGPVPIKGETAENLFEIFSAILITLRTICLRWFSIFEDQSKQTKSTKDLKYLVMFSMFYIHILTNWHPIK